MLVLHLGKRKTPTYYHNIEPKQPKMGAISISAEMAEMISKRKRKRMWLIIAVNANSRNCWSVMIANLFLSNGILKRVFNVMYFFWADPWMFGRWIVNNKKPKQWSENPNTSWYIECYCPSIGLHAHCKQWPCYHSSKTTRDLCENKFARFLWWGPFCDQAWLTWINKGLLEK